MKTGLEVYGRGGGRGGGKRDFQGGGMENCTTSHNFLQSKKSKEAGANKNRAGTRIEGYGRREV